MQTQAFRTYLTTIIVAEAEKNNITLKIDNLQGLAPLKWSCEKATLSWKDGKELIFGKVNIRIALFPLFKNQLSISFLRTHELTFSFYSLEDAVTPFSEVHLPDLPFYISAKTVQIKKLILQNLTEKKDLELSMVGTAKIHKDLKEIQFDLILIEPLLDNTLHIQMLSSEKKESINAKVHLQIKNSQNIFNFFQLPLETSLETSIRCWGKWTYWQEIKKKTRDSALCFSAKSKIDSLSVPSLPFLSGKWAIDTEVSLWSDLSSCCENLSIESNRFRLLGKASFAKDLTPLDGSAIISLEDLKDFSSVIPFPLSGKIEAKVGLKNNAFLLSITSPTLEIGKELFSPSDFKIQSTLQELGWAGTISCTLQNPDLPWEGSSEFILNSSELEIQDITLQAKETKISGTGSLDLKSYSSDGSFFLLIPELRSFRGLFPHSDFEGKIGGSCSFSYKEKDLSLIAHLIAKNVRYQSSLLNSGFLDIEAKNLFTKPSGIFSLDCENLLTKKGQIAKLKFHSTPSDMKNQSYALEVMGDWKQEFHLSSSGFWENENSCWAITSDSCQGNIFNQSFLMKPFTVRKEEDRFFLEGYSLEIGGGTLLAECSLGENLAKIKTKASHLPLDVFTLFYPNISLYGYASFEGDFLGSKEDSQGYFIATLEEGTLPSTEAKGSLQIHFGPKTAQIHTHLYATQNQFLDWTATLPISYSYSPFRLSLNEKGPIASEWISQGNIDTLFNFLQMPNQKTSGLLTSRFLLSGTPKNPYLHGDMDIQNGLYENYFIGTRGRNIEATLSASGSSLDLNSFSALDKKGGSLKATGTLLLDKQKEFPFTIHSDLTSFYFIQSDLFQTTATGNLLVEGTTQSCKATGDLQINAATFTLSDRLPQEIPTLPVRHINKPIHLQQSEIIPTSDYPINLDLHLTAYNTVFIKGRGLNSEWYGDVTLRGTPTNLIGSGSLALKKGEFVFSGKTFTLLQGDLSFSDKPGQESSLAITGQLILPSATIIANLQGALTSPRLTFQSIPQLPTSSILSLILFNKEISEISPLQALQLAQVVMSLSGNGGPDVFGAIRKTIGVDKLNISGKDGSDEIALQIGWCIAHGITVSLSQSATSSDITIEVDLKNGFLFEAETQNQEEGKFSLKWNHNY
ncbi:MAG: translocation/assembly module TamB domain-containing protein [Chlamydiota bacterium]